MTSSPQSSCWLRPEAVLRIRPLSKSTTATTTVVVPRSHARPQTVCGGGSGWRSASVHSCPRRERTAVTCPFPFLKASPSRCRTRSPERRQWKPDDFRICRWIRLRSLELSAKLGAGTVSGSFLTAGLTSKTPEIRSGWSSTKRMLAAAWTDCSRNIGNSTVRSDSISVWQAKTYPCRRASSESRDDARQVASPFMIRTRHSPQVPFPPQVEASGRPTSLTASRRFVPFSKS
jgi:hypothetical protein